jgi:hypothetical protein
VCCASHRANFFVAFRGSSHPTPNIEPIKQQKSARQNLYAKLDTRSNPLTLSVRGAFDLNQSPSACHCFRVCLIILSNIESHTSQAGELSSLYSYLIFCRSRDFAIQNPCSAVSHHVLLIVRMHFFIRSRLVKPCRW